MARPVLYVLAGVNGAGKSSVGGHLLRQAGLAWYNPDAFAREIVAATGCTQEEANAAAWQEGMRRLDQALAQHHAYAFETTLGGDTVAARIQAAARSHDVLMWFCGLATPELHLARVRARVVAGGHDIPEEKIRQRWISSRANLIALIPHLAYLKVSDNSAHAGPGEAIPDPLPVLEMENGRLLWPTEAADLLHTPEWAKPLVEAALE
ncbi:AAA family ATPase [Pseudothauera rhizosphaerae]|uniref:AAA family ATPase n=1 Tax=Pseudothauera rhizosphaerae TaxID=2565932 RepID=UPI001B3B1C8B|nr:AAA family ATPase [Pseudothauera rhizosphaerae]